MKRIPISPVSGPGVIMKAMATTKRAPSPNRWTGKPSWVHSDRTVAHHCCPLFFAKYAPRIDEITVMPNVHPHPKKCAIKKSRPNSIMGTAKKSKSKRLSKESHLFLSSRIDPIILLLCPLVMEFSSR